jgi:hypothetical protein
VGSLAPDPNHAIRVRTKVVPSYEIPKTTPPRPEDAEINPAFAKLDGLILDMKLLAEANPIQYGSKLKPLVEAYQDWIDREEKRTVILEIDAFGGGVRGEQDANRADFGRRLEGGLDIFPVVRVHAAEHGQQSVLIGEAMLGESFQPPVSPAAEIAQKGGKRIFPSWTALISGRVLGKLAFGFLSTFDFAPCEYYRRDRRGCGARTPAGAGWVFWQWRKRDDFAVGQLEFKMKGDLPNCAARARRGGRRLFQAFNSRF